MDLEPRNRHERRARAAGKAGWRVQEWADDVGVGRSTVFNWLNDGRLASVKIGHMRVITTPPQEFLRRYADGQAA